MKIIIDERETELYDKCYSIVNCEGNTTYIQMCKQVLPLGDIYLKTDEDKDIMIIERKSVQDLLASIKDGRYEEQSYRLTHSSGFPLHNIMYIIEGTIQNLPLQIKKTVFSAITSLNYFKGFSVIRTTSSRETAELLVWMANKIDKSLMQGKIPSYLLRTKIINNLPALLSNNENIVESSNNENRKESVENDIETLEQPSNEIIENSNQEQGSNEPILNYSSVVKKVKKDNITRENIGSIILCQIPGISSVTAESIMKPYPSFSEFINKLKENPTLIDNMMIENNNKKRKISKSSVENIKKYLL
jgi:crossover junction endonuclease MUS81